MPQNWNCGFRRPIGRVSEVASPDGHAIDGFGDGPTECLKDGTENSIVGSGGLVADREPISNLAARVSDLATRVSALAARIDDCEANLRALRAGHSPVSRLETGRDSSFFVPATHGISDLLGPWAEGPSRLAPERARVRRHFPLRVMRSVRANRNGPGLVSGLLAGLRRAGAPSTAAGRLLRFALVGATGVVVNQIMLRLLTTAGANDITAAVVGAELASAWNFGWTERLVFFSRPRGRWKRAVWFTTMNTGWLGLQVPVLHALTRWMGLHYLAADLLAIVAATLVRFAVADKLIWRGERQEPSRPRVGSSDAVSLANDLARGRNRPRGIRWLAIVVVSGAAVVLLAVSGIDNVSTLNMEHLAIELVLLLGSAAMLTISLMNLTWMLYAWRLPVDVASAGFPEPEACGQLSFSLIVPARHEQHVLARTLSRILEADHDLFEVIVVVGQDDPETNAIAESVRAQNPDRVRVVVDRNPKKNKAKALNTALPFCRGDVVGIFDAEDDVHPSLLRHVEACFRRRGADIVQGGVQLMNYRTSWFAVRNVLEYFFWYKSRLHLQAQRRLFPLGGNTVFIRRHLVEAAGGWDPECLAEDCELGVRLSVDGARVLIAYEPELATREETPGTVGELFRQRTRWNQGFLQVLRKREWQRLQSRRDRNFARATLFLPFAQAFLWLFLPVSVLTAFVVKVPVSLALFTILPAMVTMTTIAVEAAGLKDFCLSYDQPVSWKNYLRLILGTLPYQVVLGAAAARAILREYGNHNDWEKTSHSGQHRPQIVRTDRPGNGRGEGGEGSEGRELVLVLPESNGDGAGREGTSPFHDGDGSSRHAERDVSPRQPVRTHTSPSDVEGFEAGGAPDGGMALLLLDQPVTHLPKAGAIHGRDLDSGEAPNPQEASRSSRRIVWLAEHWKTVVWVGLLLGLIAVVHARGMTGAPGFDDDEGTYVAQAFSVQAWHRLAPYTYWYDHPPLGWILLAFWNVLTRGLSWASSAVAAGRYMVLGTQIVSFAMLYGVARRLGISKMASAAGMLAFGLSPLAVHFQRMVYLDNIAMPFLLAAFFLVLSPRRSLAAFALAGVLFGCAVLVRETTLVLLPPLLWQVWQRRDTVSWRFELAVFFGGFLGVVLLYPAMAILKDEVLPGPGHVSLIGSVKWQLFDRAPSGSIFDSTSGARHTVGWWLSLDPWLPLIGLAASLAGLAVPRLRPVCLGFLLQAAFLLRNGYLPIPYVIAMLPFAALAASGLVDRPCRAAVRALRGWRDRSWAAVTVRLGVLGVTLGVVLVVCAALVYAWMPGDLQLMRGHDTADFLNARRWIERHVPKDDVILVDDTYWVDLVRMGFRSPTPVWFYKFDLDPAIVRRFPGGWRDVNYVIMTGVMRVQLPNLPRVRAAVRHSKVVAEFTAGTDPVIIRRLELSGSSSGGFLFRRAGPRVVS